MYMGYSGGGRGLDRVAPYAAAARRAASAAGATRCVDLFQAMTASARAVDGLAWSDALYDGLHFSTKGNAFVYKQVAAALAEVGVAPAALPIHRLFRSAGWQRRRHGLEADAAGRRAALRCLV